VLFSSTPLAVIQRRDIGSKQGVPFCPPPFAGTSSIQVTNVLSLSRIEPFAKNICVHNRI